MFEAVPVGIERALNANYTVMNRHTIQRLWAHLPLRRPLTHNSHDVAEVACLAHCQNVSAASVSRPWGAARPMIAGFGSGVSRKSFTRCPAMQANNSATNATPLPASMAEVRLENPSCSSTMRGLVLTAANIEARYSK